MAYNLNYDAVLCLNVFTGSYNVIVISGRIVIIPLTTLFHMESPWAINPEAFWSYKSNR